MKKFFNKLFTSDIVLYIALAALIGGVLLYDIPSYINYGRDYMYYFFADATVCLVAIILVISYKKHQKNVMKAMMGGLFLLNLPVALGDCVWYVSYSYDVLICVLAFTYFTGMAVMFACHIFMISKHNASHGLVVTSRIAGAIVVLVGIIWEIVTIVGFEGYSPLNALGLVLSDIGVVGLICCIESKVDYFKELRDEREAAE